jgi:TonB family protein
MTSKDYYSILGVSQNSSEEEIKSAYRKLSKKFHPDLNEGDKYFEDRFREVQEAYDILCDPVLREQYDSSFVDKKEATSKESEDQNIREEQMKYGNKRSSKKSKLIVSALLILAVFTLIRQGIKKEVSDFAKKKSEEEYNKSLNIPKNADTPSFKHIIVKPNISQPELVKNPSENRQETGTIEFKEAPSNRVPSFPGGMSAWQKYLIRTLEYPQEALDREIQGVVIVKFIVNEDGSVSDIEAIDGPEELREEAARVIQRSPRWLPAIENGFPVKSYKKQPISFKLESGGENDDSPFTEITENRQENAFDTNKPEIFYLGDKINPTSDDFLPLGASSATGVYTYKYIKQTQGKMFDRQIGEIIIGVKGNVVVTTIYNLIPNSDDIGVPHSVIELIQNNLPYDLSLKNGVYGVNIDNTTISISRTRSALTFGNDRIMYFSSVKHSLLTN